jgi:glycosyltransferase involved in cell wall biosynthesis/ribosomal protein S18 acetylase RimI-like enzyme
MSVQTERMKERPSFRVAHLTTVDLSLRFLVRPQLLAVIEVGGEAIGISAPGPWVEGLESKGIRHVALRSSTRGMSLLNDLRAAFQLWRVLRRERPTILHTHNPKPGLYGRVVGRLTGVPLVVNTLHGLYVNDQSPALQRAIVLGLEAVAARFSDIELHQNPEDLDFCRRRRILPRGKGMLLGNGVDLDRFDPERVDPVARRRLRAEWGVRDDQIVVGMIGRLVVEKGYLELFEAAESLGDRYVVVAVGPEDHEKADAIDSQVLADATQSGVVFLGMRTDVDELYSAMDMFVLPSHREGFPRAAMEAAAMGLPIVATDVRGCRQVVDDGQNGVLVALRSPVELAKAIETIGEDESLRASMAAASREKALAEFDEEHVVEIVMNAYREGLVAKGLGYHLPGPMVEETEEPVLRPARPGDARALAALHSSQIGSGFLPSLGIRFMTVLYRALVAWPRAVVLVVDDEGGPIGFVAGVEDVGAFYRHFSRRHGVRALLAAFPRLLRPAVLRRAWESFSYGEQDQEIDAELLSMAVAPRARRRGIATLLGDGLLAELEKRGVGAVRVVVGENNGAAIGAYARMGFRPHGSIEVHAGEGSEVMVWTSS